MSVEKYRTPREHTFYHPYAKLEPFWSRLCEVCKCIVTRLNVFVPFSCRVWKYASREPLSKEDCYVAFKLCDACGPLYSKFPCASKRCNIKFHGISDMIFRLTKPFRCVDENLRLALYTRVRKEARILSGDALAEGTRYVECRGCHLAVTIRIDEVAFRMIYRFAPPGNVCLACYEQKIWMPTCTTCKRTDLMVKLTICRPCAIVTIQQRPATSEAYISRVFSDMVSNTIQRNKKRLIHMPRPYWKSALEFWLWLNANGAVSNALGVLCGAYHIPVTYMGSPAIFKWDAIDDSDIQLSPDRLDDDLGYDPTNVRSVPHYLNAPHKIPDAEFAFNGALEKRESALTSSDVTLNIRMAMQSICSVVHDTGVPRPGVLYEKANHMLHPGKRQHARLARGVYDYVKGLDIEIATAFLFLLWVHQGGLCKYTGIPLRLDVGAPSWVKLSPERLDPAKPYFGPNIAVICTFANTPKTFPVNRWNESTLVDETRQIRMDAARAQNRFAILAYLRSNHATEWYAMLARGRRFPGFDLALE